MILLVISPLGPLATRSASASRATTTPRFCGNNPADVFSPLPPSTPEKPGWGQRFMNGLKYSWEGLKANDWKSTLKYGLLSGALSVGLGWMLGPLHLVIFPMVVALSFPLQAGFVVLENMWDGLRGK